MSVQIDDETVQIFNLANVFQRKSLGKPNCLNMTETTRRTLRNNRRPPNYLNSDVPIHRLQDSEGDPIPNPRHTTTKDTKHGGSQTKALAELLTRFVNQTNLHYREMRKAEKDQQQNLDGKTEQNKTAGKGKVERTEIGKKKPTETKSMDEDGTRKGKPLYNFKAQHPNPEQAKPTNSAAQDKSKQIETAIANAQKKALSMGMSLQYYPYLNQAGQIKAPIPGNLPNGITPQMMAANQELSAQLLMQQQAMYNQAIRAQQNSGNPYESEHRMPWKPSSELASDSKLFKRSSFHVAIAYHIYLKNLKMTGKELTGANDIDPTWPARKMREDNTKGDSEEVLESKVQPEEPLKIEEKVIEEIPVAQEKIKEEEIPVQVPMEVEKKQSIINEVSLPGESPEKQDP